MPMRSGKRLSATFSVARRLFARERRYFFLFDSILFIRCDFVVTCFVLIWKLSSINLCDFFCKLFAVNCSVCIVNNAEEDYHKDKSFKKHCGSLKLSNEERKDNHCTKQNLNKNNQSECLILCISYIQKLMMKMRAVWRHNWSFITKTTPDCCDCIKYRECCKNNHDKEFVIFKNIT